MFEKEKRNTKINRLRIIDKYEADYNLIFKISWPKITNNIAENNSTLGKPNWEIEKDRVRQTQL